MFVKISGCVLILFSGGLIGLKLCKDYISRIEILNEMKKMLYMLKNEIKHSNVSIYEAIHNINNLTEGHVKIFLQEVVNIHKQKNIPINELWYKATDNIFNKKTYLTDKEITLIKQIGNNLGTTNKATQMENIDNYTYKIQLLIDELEKPKVEKCKMYKTMGVMAGLLIIILFV